jgi:hypothetical protein
MQNEQSPLAQALIRLKKAIAGVKQARGGLRYASMSVRCLHAA